MTIMTAPMSVNTSERRRARTEGRHGPTQQAELFGNDQPGALADIPAWQDLPTATQAVLTSLMARLILGHAETRRASPVAEAGHDL
jgi:hypothetical protein